MRLRKLSGALALILSVIILICGCQLPGVGESAAPIGLDEIPEYSGVAYVSVNGGTPFFDDEELVTECFESYAELDSLGRCGVAYACVGLEIMPPEDEERGSISSVTPSGWEYGGVSNNNEYDTELVENGYIYNRCHLIGYQLTGENANKQNLITGTRYLNIEGMLPFENQIAACVKDTEYHVLYRVTPIYEGNELVARGVLMEAISVEDKGEELMFCVYAYNVQPGIYINYANGKNCLDEDAPTVGEGDENGDSAVEDDGSEPAAQSFVLNTSSKKFHKPTCSGVKTMKEENKQEYEGTREDLLQQGYTACGTCKP